MSLLNIKCSSRLCWTLAIFTLMVIVFIYVAAVFTKQLVGSAPVNTQEDMSFPGSDVIRKGNLNGIPIAVPSNYLYFAFNYLDKSIWEASKPGDIPYDERTYGHGVAAFSLYVHWSDMQPRNWENNFSFFTKDKNGGNDWLMVSVDDDYISSPRPPKTIDNGFARVLKGKIKRLATNPVDGGLWEEREKVRVHYEHQGIDSSTGLQWAVPVGPYTELYHTWNDALYWQGDNSTVVTDLISCQNGKMSNPKSYQECWHRFEFPEMKTYVRLRYPRTWLPQWRELKAKSKTLLQGFIVDSNAIPANTGKTD